MWKEFCVVSETESRSFKSGYRKKCSRGCLMNPATATGIEGSVIPEVLSRGQGFFVRESYLAENILIPRIIPEIADKLIDVHVDQ